MTIIKPKELQECEQRIKDLEVNLKTEYLTKRSLEPRVKVQCVKCDRLTEASKLVYRIRMVHYKYALMGEQDWFRYPEFRCPHCGEVNLLEQRPEVTSLRDAFKAVEEYP